jgi:flagellar L-ring protein precursor FlgH
MDMKIKLNRSFCTGLIAVSITAAGAIGQQPRGPVRPVVAGPPGGLLTLEVASPYYTDPPPLKKIKLHDIITVVVKEQSTYLSEGNVDRRKNGVYDAVIKDWVNLTSGLTLKKTAQNDGDPRAGGTIQQTYRSESEMETRNRTELRLAATVVDIRPNGNLVIEAHRKNQKNIERLDASLTGIIRPEDILPDNTVLSEDIAELSLYTREKGHIRDSYRRGWATWLIDQMNPF